jgi:recombinational DNA repair protein RecT
MAKKTALKRLAKLLPASVELQQAVALDDRGETGESQSDVHAEMPVSGEILELDAAQSEAPRQRSQAEEMKAELEARRAPISYTDREPGMEG